MQKKSKATKRVMVTVEENRLGEIDRVESKLKSAGLSAAERSELGGVIIGECEPQNVAKLRDVPGVEAVEDEPTFSAM